MSSYSLGMEIYTREIIFILQSATGLRLMQATVLADNVCHPFWSSLSCVEAAFRKECADLDLLPIQFFDDLSVFTKSGANFGVVSRSDGDIYLHIRSKSEDMLCSKFHISGTPNWVGFHPFDENS